MHLPVIVPDIRQQQYSCHGCTNCCRELVVHLTDADRKKIDQAGWAQRLGVEPYIRMHGGYVLNHAEDGACVFLTAAGRCRIHEEIGGSEKPIACQLFPFTLEREGSGVRAGLRFDCPTVTRNEGAPLPSHRKDLERLATALHDALPGALREAPEHVALTKDLKIAPETADALLAAFDGLIARRSLILQPRLLALCELTGHLQGARLNNLDQTQLSELVAMLATDLADRGDELSTPPPPKSRWLKMLRQSAFAHAEYATFEQAAITARPSLGYRWGQLKRALRMAKGRGTIPNLSCGAGAGTFEQLRAISAELSEDERAQVDRLITRYLQARITNRGGFGRAYYSWPLLPGLHATMLSVALVGWFSRWSALRAGKSSFGLVDVQAAMRIVDRAAGRAPELGARTAELRIGYLAGEGALGSLIATYAVL